MTWHDDIRSAGWLAAVTADRRTVSSRVEAISPAGVVLGDVPVDQVSISYDGDQAEAWRATFRLSDTAMVPRSPASWLDGRSGTRLRVWWRLLVAGSWLELPVGTYVVEDPETTDSGTVTVAVSGVDPLAVARRGKYGARVVPVGNMTVTAALKRLFAVVAPGFPVAVDDSTETLPAVYELWDRDPAEDWTEIAAMAGMVVRTDRLGVITAARPPAPDTVAAVWQEGPGCPVTDLSSRVKTSTIPRRVVVVSTSPDVTPPVVGEWVNPDADTLMITTETRVESSTVTSTAAADSLARLTGERWARPQQSVQVTVPARPDLGYRDQVQLARLGAGVSGVYRVAGWELDLAGHDTPPAPMRVSMMTRQ